MPLKWIVGLRPRSRRTIDRKENKMKKKGTPSIQDGLTKDNENETKPDWEEVEKFFADPDWEEVEKWLPDYPELAEHEAKIRREATFQRILRFASEENWEKYHTELEGLQLTPKESKVLAEAAFKALHRLAWQQASHSSGQVTPESPFRIGLLYKQLNPQDGVESALTRVMVALTEATMDCFSRASESDAPPVRDIELRHAMRGALDLAALTKAFDSHRRAISPPENDKTKIGRN